MEWEAKLIYLYCTVCHFFSQTPSHKKIRNSPNQILQFTDEEVITIFIFGLMEGHKNLKNIHQFIYGHLKKWFPKLPNYSAFHHRLNELAYEIVAFADHFNCQFSNDDKNKTILIDSMPIIIAKGSRSGFSKIAKGLANLGYCASKKLYYWGVKFHLFAEHQTNSLPKPHFLEITQGSTHDLNAVKRLLSGFKETEFIADKAYSSKKVRTELLERKNILHTPVKLTKKKKFLTTDETNYSKIINSIRQPIESFFNWIIEKTGIQNASKVRSERGLVIHIFGRYAAALLILVFQGKVAVL